MTIEIVDNNVFDLNERSADLLEFYRHDEPVELIQYVRINSPKTMKCLIRKDHFC